MVQIPPAVPNNNVISNIYGDKPAVPPWRPIWRTPGGPFGSKFGSVAAPSRRGLGWPMRIKKERSIIRASDVSRIFADDQIRDLMKDAKLRLPGGADFDRFAAGVRTAASIYARDAREPTANELRREIVALYKAADARAYDDVAARVVGLSRPARATLNAHNLHDALPAADILLNAAQREAACEAIVRLCRIGGRLAKGRKRPSGKRSRPTFEALLFAPAPQRHFPKRDAERGFVMWLRVAYQEATDEPPPRTARHGTDGRRPGPFTRFVSECLRLVGARDADAVELINALGGVKSG